MEEQLRTINILYKQLLEEGEAFLKQMQDAHPEDTDTVDAYIARRTDLVEQLQQVQWRAEHNEQIKGYLLQQEKSTAEALLCIRFQETQDLAERLQTQDRLIMDLLEEKKAYFEEKVQETDRLVVRNQKITGYGNAFKSKILSGGRFDRLR